MITIEKNGKILSIPKGAYDKMYAPSGWVISGPETKKRETAPSNRDSKPEPEVEEEIVYVDPEELLEKPLEELDFQELNIVAEYLDIDTTGMKSSKALRTAIKKVKE